MAWAPDYCTSSELKDFVRVGDSVDDAQVGLAVTASSRAIDQYCNRQFGVLTVAAAKYYTARYDRRRFRWVVNIDDLMSITSLAVAVDSAGDSTYASTITSYDLKPLNAAGEGEPWSELVVRQTSTVQPDSEEDGVKITALWGWTSVPTTIKQATLLQAARFLGRRSSPFGIAGSPDMGGSEMRLLAKLDVDVAIMVAAYKRHWGAAYTPRVTSGFPYSFPYPAGL